MINYPVYIVGSREFIAALRRRLLLDSVEHIEAALAANFGPVSVQTFDGLIGVGETPALAFHRLVEVAEEAHVAEVIEKIFRPMAVDDLFSASPLWRRLL